jgi:hypothetical protein
MTVNDNQVPALTRTALSSPRLCHAPVIHRVKADVQLAPGAPLADAVLLDRQYFHRLSRASFAWRMRTDFKVADRKSGCPMSRENDERVLS